MQDNNNIQELSILEKQRLANRLSYQRNKEKRKKACLDNYYKNKDSRILKAKQYYSENREKHLSCARRWYRNNKGKVDVNRRTYRTNNRDRINSWSRERYRKCLNTKILSNLRYRLWVALKKQTANKHTSASSLVGCSIEQLKQHLESLWLPGMSWSNHTKKGWHIDHIKPCASFDLSDPEQQKICFHYTNLQPLWSTDNESKGSLYDGIRHYNQALFVSNNFKA
jgi:hypothetical protein